MSNIHKLNIARLDVAMIAALEVLLSERSVSRAARRVGLTQPAMSNALARMRIAFADPLLVRGREGMMLTARAEILLQQLTEIIPQLEALGKGPAFDPATAETTFRIALTDHAGVVLMPRVLQSLHGEAPRIRTHTSTISSRQTDFDELEAERFDLRLGWMHSLPAHWHRRKLLDEELVVVGARSNVALREPLELHEFLALDHVALATNRPLFQNLTDQALAKAGLQRNIVAQISHFAIVPFIVAGSNLVAMFPRRLANSFRGAADLQIVRSPFPFEDFNLSMAWHPRVHHDIDHRWLRNLVVRCAATIDDPDLPEAGRATDPASRDCI